MRTVSLLLAAACLLLVVPASAQTAFDAGATCLQTSDVPGQSLADRWSHAFSVFLDNNFADLTEDQAILVQQAIDFGSTRNVKLNGTTVHTMKGLVSDLREALSTDQFSEILARMGPESQDVLVMIDVIDDKEIACSCTVGAGRGCPEGFPCTVGCTTWGTGAWNGICVREAIAVNPQ